MYILFSLSIEQNKEERKKNETLITDQNEKKEQVVRLNS